MFDIGWSELLLIGVVALIAIGPKELPGVLRSVGQWMTKIRSMASEFQGQFQEALREAEMADLKKTVEDVSSNLTKPFDPSNLDSTWSPNRDTAPSPAPAETPPISTETSPISGEPSPSSPTSTVSADVAPPPGTPEPPADIPPVATTASVTAAPPEPAPSPAPGEGNR